MKNTLIICMLFTSFSCKTNSQENTTSIKEATSMPVMNVNAKLVEQANLGCLTVEEGKLINAINQFRKENNLYALAPLRSLAMTGKWHVLDLEINKPVTDNCNMHSWSSSGSWKAVCYTRDHKNAEGMWSKPKEITEGKFRAHGFENSFMHSAAAKAESALNSWKSSSGHRQVILQEGMWSDMKFTGMGVGIYGKYAVVWFSTGQDPLGESQPCSTETDMNAQ